jgi:hypothetical protein
VDPSARAQYQLYFRQSSVRIGPALAKATVQRLLATPSLPSSAVPILSGIALARLILFPLALLLSLSLTLLSPLVHLYLSLPLPLLSHPSPFRSLT